jgi:hypothetical protein
VFRALIDALAAGIEANVASGEFAAAAGGRRRTGRRVRG